MSWLVELTPRGLTWDAVMSVAALLLLAHDPGRSAPRPPGTQGPSAHAIADLPDGVGHSPKGAEPSQPCRTLDPTAPVFRRLHRQILKHVRLLFTT